MYRMLYGKNFDLDQFYFDVMLSNGRFRKWVTQVLDVSVTRDQYSNHKESELFVREI